MKPLSDILYRAGAVKITGKPGAAIGVISMDSRCAKRNSLFIAIRGTRSDGHAYISDAVKNGAVAVVCEKFPDKLENNITYVQVPDTGKALGIIASNFYGNPSAKLKLVGITGTNGKTTAATLLYHLFRSLGFKSGLISTITNCIDGTEQPATHTTPDAIRLNELLSAMAETGCIYCFMEVSSHAIVQERISGLEFTGGVFTNITHDHLDYHKTFPDYIRAKKKFFDGLGHSAFTLVNNDDDNGLKMTENTNAMIKTYAIKSMADFRCRILENTFSGLHLNIDGRDAWMRLIGEFNAYNLLAIYATSVLLGQNRDKVLTVLSGLTPPEGRLQHVSGKNGITAIVDYAHTPDALQKVLKTVNELRMAGTSSSGKTGKGGKFFTVIGCGGDRDASKRPEMGKIAAELSDTAILTSDNPRSEDSQKIIGQMSEGVEQKNKKKILIIPDRKEAIKTACLAASSGDVILVAGKGHEKYQEIKGKKYPFDDVEVLKEALNT